jgi:hypothetical protein
MSKAIQVEYSKQSVMTKVDTFTEGSFPYLNRIFKELAESSLDNTAVLCDFLEQQQNEKNVKISTTETYIKRLCWLSKYCNGKNWNQMTREDIQAFLLSNKKSEQEDPQLE